MVLRDPQRLPLQKQDPIVASLVLVEGEAPLSHMRLIACRVRCALLRAGLSIVLHSKIPLGLVLRGQEGKGPATFLGALFHSALPFLSRSAFLCRKDRHAHHPLRVPANQHP